MERVLSAGLARPLELVAVDDGSTDGSRELLEELARRHPELRPVFLPENRGKGAAIAAAIEAARGDVAVIQDADLEYDPRDIPRLIAPILEGRADAVYGSRFASASERRVLYYRHAIGNRIVTAFSNLLTDLNLTDVETGYKAFRLDLLRGLPIKSRSFEFEIEITAKLAALGARVYEVPISYHGRSYQEGKKIRWTDGLRALLAAVRFRLCPALGTARSELGSLIEGRKLARFFKRQGLLFARHSGDRVLELSPGTGAITAYLVTKGHVVCLQPDRAKADFLRRRFGHRPNVRVIEGRLGDAGVAEILREERPDSAVSAGAVASAPDERVFLKALAELLGPGGRLALLEPRGRWLFSPFDEARGRLRRYLPGELREILESAGFSVERLRAFNRAGTLAHLVWCVLLRRRSVPWTVLGFLDRLSFLWRLCEWFLPVPGLSVFVEARVRDRSS